MAREDVCGRGGMHGGGMHGKGGMHGRGHAWQGGVHGRGHAWQGGVHGRGHAWQGRHAWQILRDAANEWAARMLLE